MIKYIIKRILFFSELLGISIFKMYRTLRGLPFYINDYNKLKKQITEDSEFKYGKFYPCFEDKFDESGVGKGHYFNQDLFVAQKIFESKPKIIVDIGSRIDGFVAHVASFRSIEVFDIRPLDSNIKNIIFRQADITELDPKYYNYADAVSSLHVIEHLGLGRYGDKIDINGHLKGLDNIYKILKKNGSFYFSVPIGPQRIEFNAHRVFNIEYLLTLFKDKYLIKSFAYVGNDNRLHIEVDLTSEDATNNFGCNFGCGIFELIKI